jgi:hypothetical protein
VNLFCPTNDEAYSGSNSVSQIKNSAQNKNLNSFHRDGPIVNDEEQKGCGGGGNER